MVGNVHFSSVSDTWETPADKFKELNDEFHFTLDPCCFPESAKCDKYYTPDDDGLSKDWSNDVVFMNPPYGRSIKDWIKKGLRGIIKRCNCSLSYPFPYRHQVVACVLYEG